MILTRLRNSLEKKEPPEEVNYEAAILVVEDDVDQLDLLVSLVSTELKNFMKDERVSEDQRKKLTPINILRVSELISLQQAVTSNKNVMFALLDCNIPDAMGSAPHDQFVKNENLIVTGQHRSVDIIAQNLPGTPITLTSSMGRFQRTITQYYKDDDDLKIEFIGKEDVSSIQASIKNHIWNFVENAG